MREVEEVELAEFGKMREGGERDKTAGSRERIGSAFQCYVERKGEEKRGKRK